MVRNFVSYLKRRTFELEKKALIRIYRLKKKDVKGRLEKITVRSFIIFTLHCILG
jgi:hypothetical protein